MKNCSRQAINVTKIKMKQERMLDRQEEDKQEGGDEKNAE